MEIYKLQIAKRNHRQAPPPHPSADLAFEKDRVDYRVAEELHPGPYTFPNLFGPPVFVHLNNSSLNL